MEWWIILDHSLRSSFPAFFLLKNYVCKGFPFFLTDVLQCKLMEQHNGCRWKYRQNFFNLNLKMNIYFTFEKYTHFYFWLLEKSRCLRLFRVVIEITTLSWFHNQLWSDCVHIITDWGCFESLHGNARQIETISYFFLQLQNYKVWAVICIEIQSLCSYVR